MRWLFADGHFQYGCPAKIPTTSDPNPEQSVPAGQQPRFRCGFSFPCGSYIVPRLIFRLVPANCSTPFWDPIAAECLCTSDSCAFSDDSRPIGVSTPNAITESGFSLFPTQPNGTDLTGGGTGGNFSGDTSQPGKTYLPFNGATSKFLPSGWWQAMLLGSIVIAFGAVEVFAHLV